MGFSKPNLGLAQSSLASCIREIRSPYNDGWTSAACKKDLYMLKSWLEDEYDRLPKFDSEEKQWERDRLIQKLKQQ